MARMHRKSCALLFANATEHGLSVNVLRNVKSSQVFRQEKTELTFSQIKFFIAASGTIMLAT